MFCLPNMYTFKVKQIHFNQLKGIQRQHPDFFHLCLKIHAQLPERKHHVQNQRNQALFFFFFFFFFQMFSKCFQLPFFPVGVRQSQAANSIHFNLVFGVYSLKKTFLQDYIHSWLERSHLAFLWGVYLNLFPRCFFPLFLSISLQ